MSRGDRRAILADRGPHAAERLDEEARAVLERAAIGVGPLVEPGREELGGRRPVRVVDVDQVEARVPGPLAGLDVIGDPGADVVGVDLVAVALECGLGGPGVRTRAGHPGLLVGCFLATGPELDARQRAMLVDRIDHGPQIAHVALVPDAHHGAGLGVALGRSRRASVHTAPHPPSASSADAPPGFPADPSPARAVGHLVEAVFHDVRTDRDRLEQDVVFGIARHAKPPFNDRFIAFLPAIKKRTIQAIAQPETAGRAATQTGKGLGRNRARLLSRSEQSSPAASGRGGERKRAGGHERRGEAAMNSARTWAWPTRGGPMKTSARVVVIGGGVVGVSILYHLARAGWSEVCLVRRPTSPTARPGTPPASCRCST